MDINPNKFAENLSNLIQDSVRTRRGRPMEDYEILNFQSIIGYSIIGYLRQKGVHIYNDAVEKCFKIDPLSECLFGMITNIILEHKVHHNVKSMKSIE